MRNNVGPVGVSGSSKASVESCTTCDLRLVEQELRDLLTGYHRLVGDPLSPGPVAPPAKSAPAPADPPTRPGRAAATATAAPSANGSVREATESAAGPQGVSAAESGTASDGGSCRSGEDHRRGHSIASLPVSSVHGDHSTDVATPVSYGRVGGGVPEPAAISCALPAAREASPVDLFADALNEDQLNRSFEMQWQQWQHRQPIVPPSRPCGVLSLDAQCGSCEFPSNAYTAERQGAGSPIPPFAMRGSRHPYPERVQQSLSAQRETQLQRLDDDEDCDEYEEDNDCQRQYRHRPYDAYDGQAFTAYRWERAPLRLSDARGGRRHRRVQKGDSTTPEIATSARRTEDPSMRSGATGGRPKGPGAAEKPSAHASPNPNPGPSAHAHAGGNAAASARSAWVGMDAARFHVMVERGLAAIAAGERGKAADLPAFADSLVGAAVSAVSAAVRRRQARLRESLHARAAEGAQRGAHRVSAGGTATATASTTASTTPTASTTHMWSSKESYRLARSVADGKEIYRRPMQMHHRAQRG